MIPQTKWWIFYFT